jgi:hypothetical protein
MKWVLVILLPVLFVVATGILIIYNLMRCDDWNN